MLGIQKVEWLASWIDFTTDELRLILNFKNDFIQKYQIVDPAKPGSARTVLCVRGKLRQVQERLFRRVLAPKLKPSEFSHGGVAKRSILSYVEPHLGSKFVYKTDIASFYPTISNNRVNSLFLRKLGCHPSVARVLTDLCTYDYHLALGLVTSPLIADQIMRPFDERLAGACKSLDLQYTRFVDDITISGPYSLKSSYVRRLVVKAMADLGFKRKLSKEKCDVIGDVDITSLRVRADGPAVQGCYVEELRRQLLDHKSLGQGGSFVGPYYSRSQLEGKLNFIRWINKKQAQSLAALFRSVNWMNVRQVAELTALVPSKPVLVPS